MDSRFKGAQSIIMQGIRSSMAVPLIYSEQLLGVMVLDSQVAANAFTEKDLQLTQALANQAAVAIQNSLYAAKIEREALTVNAFPAAALAGDRGNSSSAAKSRSKRAANRAT